MLSKDPKGLDQYAYVCFTVPRITKLLVAFIIYSTGNAGGNNTISKTGQKTPLQQRMKTTPDT